MSLVLAKSFCSHICPVGLLSELLGRLGLRLVGRTLTPPRWLDLPLRGLKLLLLGFFVWAVWVAMDPAGVEAFLDSPYAQVADVKMWLFFAAPSRLTIAVLGVLVVGSVFVRDLWCRYLCPYGALVGLLGRLAPLKVARDACGLHRLPGLHQGLPGPAAGPHPRPGAPRSSAPRARTASSPARSRSAWRCARPPPRDAGCARWRQPRSPPPSTLAVVGGFRLAGHWHSSVSESEYHRRLGEISSPLYTHVGGMTMSEEPGGRLPSSR